MIAILKYPAGNICSVQNALRRIGIEPIMTDDASTLRRASHVIIPGQGAAHTTMQYLREQGLDKVILSLTQPVLGICIGMQLMCRWSDEGGGVQGLGIFDDAEVKPFSPAPSLKVPHMGWNEVNGLGHMYFVHSYRVESSRYATAMADYGGEFVAMMRNGNFVATQFHPEKSGATGEAFLRRFCLGERFEPIPAIDIINGQCVRLTKGDYACKTVYGESPVAIAQHLEQLGARRLHLVDLDGARLGHVVNLQTLKDIASSTSLQIDYGGGIKRWEDIGLALDAGASMVTIGSVAAREPELVMQWAQQLGPSRLIIGADALDGKVMVRGWKEEGGIDLYSLIDRYMSQGLSQILCTDIARDGTLQGPNTGLYRDIMQRYPDCRLIASGGVAGVADLMLLREAGVRASVLGKAYYEGRISDMDLKSLLTC